jgi:PBSX family phage portal protein
MAKEAKDKGNHRQNALRMELIGMAKKADGEELYRRAVEERDDPFEGLYDEHRLKEPPYPFQNLYMIYEESDILQSCVKAYQKNVDGFGYQMLFLGDDVKEKDGPEAKTELVRANNFFDRVNEAQSFATIRSLMREDHEVLGNGAFEVIRSLAGQIQVMYHVPFKWLRMSASTGQQVAKAVTIMRDGKPVKLRFRRYYRKYAQIRTDGRKIRWFKEFGDPRVMDANTGQYMPAGQKTGTPASEIWHFKNNFGGMSYGLPRWIGAVLSVMGRRQAEFVNYDLFENQGIPPLLVLVAGGVLTDESMETLKGIIRGMRGVENFNRVGVLEAMLESTGLEDRGTVRLDLKNLAEYRKEDQMFGDYMEASENRARHTFRIPPLYIGASENFTYATAKAAQTVAEEQVFVPERLGFDEEINNLLIPELVISKWAYKTKGPRIVSGPDLSQALKAFTDAGAFSVNHAIERANEAFGLEMSLFDKPWADYPVPFVMEMIKSGEIRPMDLIEGMTFEGPPEPKQLPAPQKLLVGPGTGGKSTAVQKMMQSDLFTNEEKSLYKLLLSVQNAIERGHLTDAEVVGEM